MANTTSGRPTTVTVSFIIWLVVILANILSGIIGLVSGGSAAAAQGVGTAPLVGGAIFAFIVSFDQFPVSLFLVSPGRETLPITLFNYLKYDLDGTIAAASMVSILLAVVVVLVLDRTVGLRTYVRL